MESLRGTMKKPWKRFQESDLALDTKRVALGHMNLMFI